MLLTDGVHLVSDSDIIELHRFAIRVGMKPDWFQGHRIPHYDCWGSIMARVAMQADKPKLVTTRELVKRAIRATKRV